MCTINVQQYSSVGIVSLAHAKPDNNCSEIRLSFSIHQKSFFLAFQQFYAAAPLFLITEY